MGQAGMDIWQCNQCSYRERGGKWGLCLGEGGIRAGPLRLWDMGTSVCIGTTSQNRFRNPRGSVQCECC